MTDVTLERALGDIFAAGPGAAPGPVVDRGIAAALATTQRRPRIEMLDRGAWPPRRWSLANPALGRTARAALAVVLLAAIAAAVALAGAHLLQDSPPPLVHRPTSITAAGVLPGTVDAPRIVALDDGRVLIAGGTEGGLGFIFEPTTGAAHQLGGAANVMVQAALGLPDGRVAMLVWEYADPTPAGRSAMYLVEPRAGTVIRAGEPLVRRFEAAAGVLPDGRVLIAGGIDNPESPLGPITDVEFFDPRSGAFAKAAPLAAPHAGDGLVVLRDGRVLVTGWSFNEAPPGRDAIVTLLDPTSGISSQVARIHGDRSVSARRVGPVLLGDGRVLIEGAKVGPQLCGIHGSDPIETWIFDPATDDLIPGRQLPHEVAVAIAMPDGRVVVAGRWQTIPGGCGAAADYVTDDWLGVHDPSTGMTIESASVLVPNGALGIDALHLYTGGASLPDGRIALVSQDYETSAGNAIDILSVVP